MNKFLKTIVVVYSSLFLSFAANSVEVKFGHVGKPGSLFSASVATTKIAKKVGNVRSYASITSAKIVKKLENISSYQQNKKE